jgi:uncharacterized protein YecE (DUF72 family)
MAKTNKTPFLIGCSGWSYSDWRGTFYPRDLPMRLWFDFYKQHFKIIEINATFYRFFPKKIYVKWYKQASADFRYMVKVPRMISHYKRLKNCKSLIKLFCKSVSVLKNKLALILLQLPPSFVCDLKLLEKTILSFDDPKKLVIEFRNKTWLIPETLALLKKYGCTYCAADSPDIALKDWLTSNTGYIRLHGKKEWFDYKYTKKELMKVKVIAKKMIAKGASQVFILFNNDYYAYAVQNAKTLENLLGCSKSSKNKT